MKKKATPKLAPPQAEATHHDLIPREAVADLRNPNGMAMAPDTRPMLQVTPAVAQTLQRGIARLASELEDANMFWERAEGRAARSEQVLRIYLQFLENVTKGKQDGDYIREATTHLLGIMY